MNSVTQEDNYGCGIACVAYILNVDYSRAKILFKNGDYRAKNCTDFYCKEIVEILNQKELNYEYKYIKPKIKKIIYKPLSIVFLARSKKYPAGHYLCRTSTNSWMDSWINISSGLKEAKSGFRKRLPGRAIYVIYAK